MRISNPLLTPLRSPLAVSRPAGATSPRPPFFCLLFLFSCPMFMYPPRKGSFPAPPPAAVVSCGTALQQQLLQQKMSPVLREERTMEEEMADGLDMDMSPFQSPNASPTRDHKQQQQPQLFSHPPSFSHRISFTTPHARGIHPAGSPDSGHSSCASSVGGGGFTSHLGGPLSSGSSGPPSAGLARATPLAAKIRLDRQGFAHTPLMSSNHLQQQMHMAASSASPFGALHSASSSSAHDASSSSSSHPHFYAAHLSAQSAPFARFGPHSGAPKHSIVPFARPLLHSHNQGGAEASPTSSASSAASSSANCCSDLSTLLHQTASAHGLPAASTLAQRCSSESALPSIPSPPRVVRSLAPAAAASSEMKGEGFAVAHSVPAAAHAAAAATVTTTHLQFPSNYPHHPPTHHQSFYPSHPPAAVGQKRRGPSLDPDRDEQQQQVEPAAFMQHWESSAPAAAGQAASSSSLQPAAESSEASVAAAAPAVATMKFPLATHLTFSPFKANRSTPSPSPSPSRRRRRHSARKSLTSSLSQLVAATTANSQAAAAPASTIVTPAAPTASGVGSSASLKNAQRAEESQADFINHLMEHLQQSTTSAAATGASSSSFAAAPRSPQRSISAQLLPFSTPTRGSNNSSGGGSNAPADPFSPTQSPLRLLFQHTPSPSPKPSSSRTQSRMNVKGKHGSNSSSNSSSGGNSSGRKRRTFGAGASRASDDHGHGLGGVNFDSPSLSGIGRRGGETARPARRRSCRDDPTAPLHPPPLE